MGDNLPFVDMGSNFNVSYIATGEWHSLSVSVDGLLQTWGYAAYGQLGYGDYWWRGDHPNEMGDWALWPIVDLGSGLSVVSVADSCQADHTCVWLSDENDYMALKCFGLNDLGQLGVGDTSNRGNQVGEMGDDLPIVMGYQCMFCP